MLRKKILNHFKRIKAYSSADDCVLISFHVDGGLGDHLIAAQFIFDLRKQTIPFEFDVYSRRVELNEWLYEKIDGFRHAFLPKANYKYFREKYCFELNVHSCLSVRRKVKLECDKRADFRVLSKVVSRIDEGSLVFRRYVDHRPHFDGYFGQQVALLGYGRHDFGHHLAGISYTGKPLSLEVDNAWLERLSLKSKRYITLSNGYDDAMKAGAGGLVTKVFPRYDELVAQLRCLIPADIQLVQVGAANSTPISGMDHYLANRTSLKEVAGLLSNSLIHIDNEGGLVHLAHHVGTRSAVIFGPTQHEYFGYKDNLNFAPSECGGCWWMRPDWMQVCVRGDIQPRCMASHDVSIMAKKIAAEIFY